jgi:hypothetical protein
MLSQIVFPLDIFAIDPFQINKETGDRIQNLERTSHGLEETSSPVSSSIRWGLKPRLGVRMTPDF